MHRSYPNRRVIGLLGGSFNPAHGGHLHISQHALKSLGLDEVWWLVSPQNPLKSKDSLAVYGQRLQSARKVASADRRIRVTDIEARYRLRFSWQTISLLKKRYPQIRFVWLMGADNLAHFHRWRRWQHILTMLPVVVFDRAPYSHTSLRSKTYLRMQRFLLKNNHINADTTAPGLLFVHLRRDPRSSSALRKKLGAQAFLGHNKYVRCD